MRAPGRFAGRKGFSMADYDNRALPGQASTAGAIDAGLRSYMLRVYNYMLVGLLLTGATAYLVANVPQIRELFFAIDPRTGRMGMSTLGLIALFAPIGLVLLITFRLQKMSLAAAQGTFWLYAALVGISLAPLLLVYTGASVAQTFFITAATFGTMSLWGYTTKTDLTGFGSFLFMGLIGLLIASVVNIFFHSTMMMWVISVAGVLIFTGLTAYDTQYIKNNYLASDDSATSGKKAIFGALKLYLDFVNLFVMLLRLMGSRR
jgi:FtsH-binding integral membrane protein